MTTTPFDWSEFEAEALDPANLPRRRTASLARACVGE